MSEDKARARLGRGLAALIGSGGTAGDGPARASLFPGGNAGERMVEIGRLSPNPRNPRRDFGAEELAELAASIRNHGIVQPILVRRRSGEGHGFEIVAGERRWRAAKEAGLGSVPVVVRDIDDRQSLEIAIIENVQRADLNALEEARAYEALIGEHGYTQGDLADMLGKSRSHVANTLRLLKLPDSVQALVRDGSLSPGAARTAVSAEDPLAFARRIVADGLSVREAEEAARRPPADAAPAPKRSRTPPPPTRAVAPSPGTKDADTLALEALLAETLAMPVSIDLRGRGGRLILDFADLDQLDEICRLLQTRRERGTAEPRVRSL